MLRVLVCGGRNYGRVLPDTPSACLLVEKQRALAQKRKVDQYLDYVFKVDEENMLGVEGIIIHGGANGADQLADDYAVVSWKDVMVFKANWDREGKSAGPKRNQQMLDEGKPDVVVAFPGGRGTADMVRRAKKAGVQVIEVKS
jgi:hypothetical protein